MMLEILVDTHMHHLAHDACMRAVAHMLFTLLITHVTRRTDFIISIICEVLRKFLVPMRNVRSCSNAPRRAFMQQRT